MKTNFQKVKEFHETFLIKTADKASLPDDATVTLRLKLIEEEVTELYEAIADKNLTEVADALTDILYVVYGAGDVFGIDLDACFEEVHSSNMSKLDKEGKPIFRRDGKILKGPDFVEPNLEKFVK